MKYNSMFLVPKLDDPNSPRVRAVCQDVKNVLDLPEIGDTESVDENTLVVAVGGDGTAIEAMKIGAAHDADVMCFNLGRIGFLADYEPTRVFEYIRGIANGHSIIEERTIIQAATAESLGIQIAVNDIVVSRLYADEMLVYDLFVDGAYAGSHRANGVIISTPTGSTAYALSAGGAILHPCTDVVQIVPVAPSTMTSRPIIVPASAEIIIKVDLKSIRGNSKQIVVRSDGQVTPLGAEWTNDEDPMSHQVHINAYPKKARILHQSHWNYFDVLTQKLYWNK